MELPTCQQHHVEDSIRISAIRIQHRLLWQGGSRKMGLNVPRDDQGPGEGIHLSSADHNELE